MSLRFYNTPAGEIQNFKPIKDKEALIYTCGPTVYDTPHIGNWVSYIYWDTLVRILMANDYKVTRVLNITDVGHLTSDADEGEDKLEKGAKRDKKTAWEVAEFYTNIFLDGMKQLNLTKPEHIAKATKFIPQQIKILRELKAKGYTYQIEDGIYYDTSKFPTYADFAHLDLEAQKAGARVGYNQEKRNPSDFALWKFSAPEEKRDMEWETPQDLLDTSDKKMGFPGWHLECSAMALDLLGETIDIHTGGIDHIPVHHTNEIAQSEAVTGKHFSNYWLHNNHMKVNGTKISKSLSNGYTLDDLKERGFSPIDYKMLVLQSHYRSESNFTFESLQSAKNRLNNWRNIAVLRHQINSVQTNDASELAPIFSTSKLFLEALNEDIGTPEALKIIDEAFTKITSVDLDKIDRQVFIELLELIDSTLGLSLINSTPDISDTAKQIMLERKQVRSKKDWAKSDELRNQLLAMGIVIRDNQNDSVWEYK